MQDPHNLYVARYAEELVADVYRFIATLPPDEKYNLVSQMRRSASSIEDNINDGCGRKGNRALVPFLYHSHASAGELYKQLQRTRRLNLGDQPMAASTVRKAGRMKIMLVRLIKALEARLDNERR